METETCILCLSFVRLYETKTCELCHKNVPGSPLTFRGQNLHPTANKEAASSDTGFEMCLVQKKNGSLGWVRKLEQSSLQN